MKLILLIILIIFGFQSSAWGQAPTLSIEAKQEPIQEIMKKIDIITKAMTSGGAERVMTLLANATAKRGIETDMVVLQDMERTYQVDEKVNIIQFKHEKYNPIIKAFKKSGSVTSLFKT